MRWGQLDEVNTLLIMGETSTALLLHCLHCPDPNKGIPDEGRLSRAQIHPAILWTIRIRVEPLTTACH